MSTETPTPRERKPSGTAASQGEQKESRDQPKGDSPVTLNALADLLQRVLEGQPAHGGRQDRDHRRSGHRLDPAQRRLALNYGAVRNASGFFGRLGNEVVLVPSTIDDDDGTLTFDQAVLPSDGRTAVVYDAAGTELQRVELTDSTNPTTGAAIVTGDVNSPEEVAWVEVCDDDLVPLRLSIPAHLRGGLKGGTR